MDNFLKRILTLVLCLTVAFYMVACQPSGGEKSVGDLQNGSQQSSSQAGEDGVGPVKPVYEVEIAIDATNLVSENARNYLNSAEGTAISGVVSSAGRSDLGLAAVIKCTSNALEANGKEETLSGSVVITEVGALEGKTVSINNGEAKIYNLKTGTEYEFSAEITTEENGVKNLTGNFVTEDTIRLLRVSNIVNARDIGNRTTADGKKIKQGMLYRGSELDGLVESAYLINTSGKKVFTEDFKIKTIFDLRNPDKVSRLGEKLSAYPAVFGEEIPRTFYNAKQYTEIFSTDGKENIRAIFADLAKAENYPVYLHCTYGCDRTGTICMLLDGILGCTEETALRGYELSALYKDFPQINRNHSSLKSMLSQLKALYSSSDKAYSARVEAYLSDCGVTAAEIASIREIFLGN